ncbi:MAG: hypothetical protein ACKO7G_06055 [Gammaproteobacteria bacterium]
MAIDLNALRDVVRQNQTNQERKPDEPSRQVMVDKEGNVRFGDQVSRNERATQVPQETFAGAREGRS